MTRREISTRTPLILESTHKNNQDIRKIIQEKTLLIKLPILVREVTILMLKIQLNSSSSNSCPSTLLSSLCLLVRIKNRGNKGIDWIIIAQTMVHRKMRTPNSAKVHHRRYYSTTAAVSLRSSLPTSKIKSPSAIIRRTSKTCWRRHRSLLRSPLDWLNTWLKIKNASFAKISH